MSTVFYRWGAGRDESRVTFDGTHISVFDLKREIILSSKMGNGRDFDLAVYDNVTGEGESGQRDHPQNTDGYRAELKDDNHQIPRSSSLIARRLPSAKGRGNAQNYIAGTTAAEALTGDHRIEAHAREAMLAKQNKGLRGAGGTYASMTKRFDGKEDKPVCLVELLFMSPG
jgi:protein MPE1